MNSDDKSIDISQMTMQELTLLLRKPTDFFATLTGGKYDVEMLERITSEAADRLETLEKQNDDIICPQMLAYDDEDTATLLEVMQPDNSIRKYHCVSNDDGNITHIDVGFDQVIPLSDFVKGLETQNITHAQIVVIRRLSGFNLLM